MECRYIALLDNGDQTEVQAANDSALRDIGMEVILSAGALRLFISKETPTLSVPGHGLLIGRLFCKDGQHVTAEKLSSGLAGQQDFESHILRNYWGQYLLVVFKENDEEQPTILRDPSGSIPCVYSTEGRTTFITSSISLATRVRLCSKAIDYQFIAHSLSFPYLRTGRTSFLDVQELLPGCALTLGRSEAQLRMAWSPWNFVAKDTRYKDPREATASIRNAVKTVVRTLAQVDGSCLLELSGGLDSSIVATCLREVDAQVICCTMVTPVAGTDERHYAMQMAERLGRPLQSVEIRFENARFDFSPPVDSVAPGIGVLQYAINDVMKAAGMRNGVTNFYSGGGGDTIFCYLKGASPAADAFNERGIAAGLAAIRNLSTLHQCTMWKAGKLTLKKLMRGPNFPWKADRSYLNPYKAPVTPERHPWFDSPSDILLGDREKVWTLIGSHSFGDGALRDVGGCTRYPLLAQPVVEACLRVPTWMWITEGRNRYIARAAFADELPDDILYRRSKGTYINYSGAIFARNKTIMRDFLMDGHLNSHDLLDSNSLLTFFRKDPRPRDWSFLRIFDLCMVENWVRHHA